MGGMRAGGTSGGTRGGQHGMNGQQLQGHGQCVQANGTCDVTDKWPGGMDGKGDGSVEQGEGGME